MLIFGRNLERLRKDHNLSQAQLGKLLGLTQQMVSSYEKGFSTPNLDVLIKLADHFNISIDALVGHEVTSPEEGSSEARFFRYYQCLGNSDKEKCMTIIKTLLQDRTM